MKGLLEALKANVRILRPSKGGSSGAKDRTFLITGTLSQKRSEIEKRIVASGGTMASSVSKNLNYLVIGEEPGSKLDKAKKLGIPTIGEDELNKMLQ